MISKARVPLAAAIAVVMMLAVGTAWAAGSTQVVDRGLPDDNLNNAAGASRSNVAWAFYGGWVAGDDFTVGQPG